MENGHGFKVHKASGLSTMPQRLLTLFGRTLKKEGSRSDSEITSVFRSGPRLRGNKANECKLNIKLACELSFILYICTFYGNIQPTYIHFSIICISASQVTHYMHLSRLMKTPTICIREADQRLCFRYSDSTIPLLLKSEISSF